MKILVTGGAGFIGSHIVDAYIDMGHTVVAVDNLLTGKQEFVNKKATFYKADIRDKEEIEKIFQSEKPEVINHHAAQISVRTSVEDPVLDAQINIIGLLNILNAGVKNGAKKVIFASSGGVVYGDAQTIPTPDDYQPLKPLSPYGVTKLASEHYLYFYSLTYGITYTALRYANVYGPRQNPHGEAGVVAIFSKKLLKGEQPVINGDGSQTRDYVFVGDVVEANKLSLTQNITGSFNIGTGIETDVTQIFQGVAKAAGSKGEPGYGPAKKGEQKRSALAVKRTTEVLGWKSQISLSEGLARTVAYFKNS